MRLIKGLLTPELKNHVGNNSVAQADAFPVRSFRQLTESVAHLSYLNMDYHLFFRGQGRDYLNKAGSSTIYPLIYRGERVPQDLIDLRFEILKSAAARLCNAFEADGIEGFKDVRKRRYIQWSILQHYEVCPTPLLDLSQSLRVACSFAFLNQDSNAPHIFLFGLPYVTNRVSINSEHDLVNIRLLSICPPAALRPHFQEGYLAGTDEVTTHYDNKSDLDFNSRLIAKFRLEGGSRFWSGGFSQLSREVLYPPKDKVEKVCHRIKEDVAIDSASPGKVGEFLQEWTKLESTILTMARSRQQQRQVYTALEALNTLKRTYVLPDELLNQLHQLRELRNQLVHSPAEVLSKQAIDGLNQIYQAINQLQTMLL
ncbi:FRG domain-containing protein [Gemmatimonadota bacterium]